MFNFFKKKPVTTLPMNSFNFPVPSFKTTAGISPSLINNAERRYNEGNLKEITAIYNQLLNKDDELAGAIDTRLAAIKARSFAYIDIPEKQAEYYKHLNSTFLPEFIKTVIFGRLFGYSFAQISYDFNDGLYYPVKIKTYEKDQLDLRIYENTVEYYEKEKVVNTADIRFYKKAYDRSVLGSLVKYYVFTSFALNNWAQFCETYGKPLRIGKYKAGTSEEEKSMLVKAITELGTDLGAVVSDNVIVEFIDNVSKTATGNLYQALITLSKTAVTKRILGQTLTTSAPITGSYAQAKVHNLVREDIAKDDLDLVKTEWLNYLNRLHAINFGAGRVDGNWLKFKTLEEMQTRLNIDEKLYNIGIEFPEDYFYNTYDIPKPQNFKASLRHVFSKTGGGVVSLIPKDLKSEVTALLASLKSYEDIKNANAFMLAMAYGKSLSLSIIKSYVKARKSRLNAKKANSNNINRLNRFYANINVDYEFNKSDAKALYAFSAEAFSVAHVQSAEALAMLKAEAQKAYTEGISFTQFAKNVRLKGFEPNNPYHLRTNFNTAINSGYLAGKWMNIEEDKKLFPYLRYVAVMDDVVRDEHMVLHDVIKKTDDAFWLTHYPPNGWNCRCSVEQLTADEAQTLGGETAFIPPIKIDPDFTGNLAIDNSLYGRWLKNKHIPEFDYQELKLNKFEEYQQETLPDLFDTKEMTHDQLIELWKKVTNDRIITNVYGTPVLLKKDVSKFIKVDLNDLRGRFQYLNCIEDVIKAPHEIWSEGKPESRSLERFSYFKRYSKNVHVLVDLNINGELEAFNIVLRSKDINNKRKGLPIYIKTKGSD